VLGSKSELLDQGRKVRLHTEPQRIAMIARDRTCAAEYLPNGKIRLTKTRTVRRQ
jgi:hypothetical protein